MNIDPSVRLGILGGGQLGQMMLQSAISLGLKPLVLETSRDSSCGPFAPELVLGDFRSEEVVYNFGKNLDIVTLEIEQVSVKGLERLEEKGVKVFPSSRVLKVIQDKGLQKEFYAYHGFPTSPFCLIKGIEDLKDIKLPVVQKLRTGGYDGRGVKVLKTQEDLKNAFPEPSVVEDLVEIDREISVIVVRSERGECKCFPCVEMVFDPETHLVNRLQSPAVITPDQAQKAQDLAISVAEALGVVGLLAVEMFLDKKGQLLINEIAPRPHNSGHHTIEANFVSQFEAHLRAGLGWPLGSLEMRCPAVMINLVGAKGFSGKVVYEGLDKILEMEGVYPHLYGKSETRPGRKMGHVTVLGNTLKDAQEKADRVEKIMRVRA